MAISWSGYKSVGGPVSFRAGIDITYSPSTVTSSTASVTVTTRLYLGASGPANASGGSWSVSGSDSGSGSQVPWSISGSGGSALIATLTETVTLAYGSTKAFTINATIRPSGSWPGSVSHSRTITLPARPVSAPAAPSGVSVARVSDTRQTVSWSRNATTAAPYSSQRVARAANGGTYVVIGNLSGTATSFTDSTTVAGIVYTYQVQAVNSAGVGKSASVNISTTPVTPAAPTAAKQTSGNIVVSRPALSASATHWSVGRSGGATLVTDLPASQATWTHSSPSKTETWAYVVSASAAASGSTPRLVSSWSAASNTIQLEAPPYAPGALAPVAADAAEDIVLTWNHAPADGAPQVAYEVETDFPLGSGYVSTGRVVSPDSRHVIPAGTYTNGGTLRWRVRTWGTHPDPGNWSSRLTNTSARPVAGITSPEGTWDSQILTVEWTFHDAENSAQSAWRAVLSTGTDVLEIREGSAPATRSTTFATPVTDGGTYTVTVETRDGALLWSEPVDATFEVAYNPPPNPSIEATWHKDDGYVTLSVDVPEPGAGEELVSHLRVERATADGWVLVADELDAPATVVDMIPPTNSAVAYRAVAVSILGSLAVTETVVETRTRWVFLNHGPGFGDVVRVYGNLSAGREFERAKVLHQLAGRAYPVERAGTHRTRTYNLTATLFGSFVPPDMTSSWADVEALGDALAPVCVRSPAGARLFTSVGRVSLPDEMAAHSSVSIPLTVVDWSEV